jgi:lipoate-protein ligase A
MARDAALLARAAETGESVFAVYSWSRPTLSFGRNQRAAGQYAPERMKERGLDVVRRPTGGRAILHHREITNSVTAPIRADESLRASYQRINLILIDGLRRLGVNASVAAGGVAHSPDATPCFVLPSDGEIIADSRKLVGSAQWREESAFLQHGSILLDDDQSSLASLGTEESVASRMTTPAPATLSALLGKAPGSAELAQAMFSAVMDREATPGTILVEKEIRPFALARMPEFLDERWTWRR